MIDKLKFEGKVQAREAAGQEGWLAAFTGTAGVPPAMSAQREQFDHSTLSTDVADAGGTPAVPVKLGKPARRSALRDPRNMLNQESLGRAAKLLARRDEDLASILKQYGPPPLWARKAGFATLIQIILEQQVSLASAAALFARMNKSIVPFRPAQMLLLGEPHLKSLGLTRQKTAYCLHLSQLLAEKRLKLSQLSRCRDEDAKARLLEVKGIGSWSADIYLLMALGRPDIWPSGDLALATAVKELKVLKVRPAPDELNEIGERWRPFRSVAARMLWQHYLANHKDWRKREGRKANC